MKKEREPVFARTIPPQIAEAVAGMELVGADLVDRKTIIEAIDVLKGDSLSDRLVGQLSKSIGQSLLESMTNRFANSGAIAAAEAMKSSQVLANSLINKSVLESMTNRFANSGAIAAAEAMKSSQVLANSLINKSVLERMTKSFESSGMKAVAEAARISQARIDKISGLSDFVGLTKSFESSGMKAVAEAARVSQTKTDQIAALSIMKTFEYETKTLSRVIRQMNNTGWLVPTKTRGLWEFSSGSQVGTQGSSNIFLPLMAALMKRSNLDIAVSMESAAFIHELSEHPPRKGVIAVAKGTSRKGALANYRHVNLNLGEEATVQIDGVPVHSIMGLLAAMAIRPFAYRDWPNVKTWLPKACENVILQDEKDSQSKRGILNLIDLLEGYPISAYARAAYFFRFSDQQEAVDQILKKVGTNFEGPIYLGPRESLNSRSRYDSVTKVYDNLIDYK
jgi:hypothetical protein